MKCHCTKFIFLAVSIVLTVVALLVVSFGYIVPLIQSEDYTLQSCKVSAVQITQPSNYHGIVTLGYLSLLKDIDVFNSVSRSIVQSYLDTNYKLGASVQCLVSSDDIRVSIFISQVGLIFTVFIAISAILCAGIFVVLHLRELRKRKGYNDLPGQGDGQEPNAF